MNETKTATEVLEVAIGGGTLRSLLCDHHTKLARTYLSAEYDGLQWTLNTLDGGGACEECCALPQRGDTLVQRLERAAVQATSPTESGFYWVRVRDDGRYIPEEHRGERVVWYEADPDDARPVRVHGNERSFRIADFEWLEGPIRRKT